MTGPLWSVLGNRTGTVHCHVPRRPDRVFFEPAQGETALMGAVFEIDPSTGKCNSVTRVLERMNR